MARPAAAYRPFDGTHADVAQTGDLELELGPAHFYRVGEANYLLEPVAVLNLGFLPRFEAVCDARNVVAEHRFGDASRATLQGTDLLLKWLAREGELQGHSGASLAFEGGVLTPESGGARGFGAQLAAIVSRQWQSLSLHLNEQVAATRDQRLDLFSGVIVEAPQAWSVRPVAEVFLERTGRSPLTRSALLGLIWPATPRLALDTGLRAARQNQKPVLEFRLGFTWALSLWSG